MTGNNKKLIVVNSVKGGCGKTTLAMVLAQHFGASKPDSVCYIDADIVGIGTNALADNNYQYEQTMTAYVQLNPFENPDYFKTDLWDTPQHKFYEFISERSGARQFNAIFTSTKKEKIDKAISSTNDLFFFDEIKEKFKILLAKLFGLLPETGSNAYDIIIIDTSPGKQGLTNIILKLMEELEKEGLGRPFEKKKIITVVNLFVSTNNFAHMRSLAEYDWDSISNKENLLIVLNQIPLGIELTGEPEQKNISLDELDKITDTEDSRVKEFIKLCKLPDKNQERSEIYKKTLLDAFKNYHRVRQPSYLTDYIDDINKDKKNSSLSKNDWLKGKFVIVPEVLSLKQMASEFGRNNYFDSERYFEELKERAVSFPFTELTKRIETIFNKNK